MVTDGIDTSMLYIWFVSSFIFWAFAKREEKIFLQKVPEKVYWLIKTTIILLSAMFIVFLGFCSWGMNKSSDVPLDYIIVLGGGVEIDQPSLTLRRRLEKAREYAIENPDTVIIGTGSIDKYDDSQLITEGQCMWNWLTEKGIDSSRIIKEEKATSTRENFAYSLELIEKGKYLNIGVVTSNFHVFRAMSIGANIGKEHGEYHFYGIAADFPVYLLPHYMIREFCATVLYTLRGDLSLPW